METYLIELAVDKLFDLMSANYSMTLILVTFSIADDSWVDQKF